MRSDRKTGNPKLVTISYRSEALLSDGLHDLVSIVEESKLRNAACDITGVLLFDGSFFLQTLEGPLEETRHMYTKILQDSRHTKIKSLPMQEIDERDFPNWHMELIGSDETASIVEGLGAMEFSYRRLRELQAMTVDLIMQREKTYMHASLFSMSRNHN